ncbi:MAG: hypothetical protein ACLR23_02920 [Clostridia bacterium]
MLFEPDAKGFDRSILLISASTDEVVSPYKSRRTFEPDYSHLEKGLIALPILQRLYVR